MSAKTAVILFNLGGPDAPAAVEPFLRNLFSDPAILRLPGFLRGPLARLIAARRAPVARDIYEKMGGGSPILANTQAQARALEKLLGPAYRCFIIMRYWHPRAAQVVQEITKWEPERVILLPLYPQFSTTTTASSVAEFMAVWPGYAKTVCCYPADSGFITAQADIIRPLLEEASRHGRPRLLLSAHGLPEKIIRAGDPYQWQCEQTAHALVAALGTPGLDWINCYQSRVGPLKWIGPSTENEIVRAGHDGVPVVLAPIAFVSEHSETLVELDIEYRDLAHRSRVPYYGRAATVGTHPAFIAALAGLVQTAQAGEYCPRRCPAGLSGCPCGRM